MSANEGARLEVVDAHCHVPSPDFLPRSFVESTMDNVVAALGRDSAAARAYMEKLADELLGDPDCDRLVAAMDEAGVAQALLLVPDFTYAMPDCPLSIEAMHDRARAVRDRHRGRFEVIAGVDPRWGEDGVALLERGLRDHGFRGTKVYPPCGFSPSDESLYPFYELCRAYEVPVVVHLGGSSHHLAFDTARPADVDRAARDFRDVAFVLAHAGTTWPEESAMLGAFRPNVYLEVSGFQARSAAPLERLTERGVGHKMLFGSDWPVFGAQANLGELLARLQRPDGPLRHLRQREVEMFFAGNARRLMLGRAADRARPRTSS